MKKIKFEEGLLRILTNLLFLIVTILFIYNIFNINVYWGLAISFIFGYLCGLIDEKCFK